MTITNTLCLISCLWQPLFGGSREYGNNKNILSPYKDDTKKANMLADNHARLCVCINISICFSHVLV